jgi:biotin synthase
MDWMPLAEQVLAGTPPSREQALAVATAPDEELLAVLDAAFRVRHHHFGTKVRVHILQNAESGVCSEDCSFCSQSLHFKSPVPRYGIQSVEDLVEGARRAHASGAVTYCMVTSTRGPSDRELDRVCEAVRQIKSEMNLRVCTSLGLLKEGQAEILRAAGVDRYNHNLETSERFYPEICSTHAFQDRVMTLRHAKQAGMEACAGGIVGMGETAEDRVDLAFALRELGVESVPVNFLNPRPNTPLENVEPLSPRDCLAMFRLVHPDRDVRAAGGREACLKHLQPLALYAANSIFTNGYLTTPGQDRNSDWDMIAEAGFEPVLAEEEELAH